VITLFSYDVFQRKEKKTDFSIIILLLLLLRSVQFVTCQKREGVSFFLCFSCFFIFLRSKNMISRRTCASSKNIPIKLSSKRKRYDKEFPEQPHHHPPPPLPRGQQQQSSLLLDSCRKINTTRLEIYEEEDDGRPPHPKVLIPSHSTIEPSSSSSSSFYNQSIRLPFEILVRIFEQLNLNDILNCACICRSWYRVVISYADLYRYIVFDPSRFQQVSDAYIARIINRASNRAHSLELHRLSFSRRLTSSISSDIYRHLKCLKLVGHRSSRASSSRGLGSFLDSCQDQLYHLEFEHLQLDREATRLIWNKFVRLRYLRLSDVDMDTHTMIQSGPPVWRELQDCIIEQDTSWTSTTITYLVQTASLLVQLRLVQCERVSLDVIYSLASLCSHLTRLSLVGLTNNNNTTTTTTPTLTNNTNFMLPHLSSTMRIATTTTTTTAIASPNVQCTLEAGFLTLAYSNPSLVEIRLQGWSTCLSNRVIEHLGILCQDLRILDLGSAPHLTDSALGDLGLYCPLLEVFQVQDVHAITPVGIFNFSHHCLQLRRLHLDRCSINDTSLKLLTSSLTKLRYLSLDQAQITGSILVEALRPLKKLKWLSINVCPMITNNVLVKIRYEFPQLRLVAQLLSIDETRD
jgi:hypothetical protein